MVAAKRALMVARCAREELAAKRFKNQVIMMNAPSRQPQMAGS
jgi:hypothetical protein